MAKYEIVVLGTGTSQGVPVIGCQCQACTSIDDHDKRLRCSLLVRSETHTIVIDAGPDFRQQMLAYDVSRLDALFLTHEHNDHIIGLDDVRPYIFLNKKPLIIYGLKRVLEQVRSRFAYAFDPNPYPGIPRFDLRTIKSGNVIELDDIKIEAIKLHHGNLDILGYIINDKVAYCTDTNKIPENFISRLRGIEVLIIDALRFETHHSHFSVDEAIKESKRIGAKKTFLTHLSHHLGRTEDWSKRLPNGVAPAYDGLTLLF